MTTTAFGIAAFGPFYDMVVPRATVDSRLRAAVTGAADATRVEGLLDAVRGAIISAVESQSARTLIGAFQDLRCGLGLPRSPDSDEALRKFRSALEDGAYRRQLLDDHPVLGNRLANLVDSCLDAYAEFFGWFVEDRAALHDAGLVTTERVGIDGISISNGDLHNNHRRVLVVRLSSGERLVFKPRTLQTDAFVSDLYALADPQLKHSLRGCAPRSLSRPDHGWQEFVVPKDMTEPDQPERYYYRFGALCALFGSIGAGDLHHENVLAYGEHPCVIDTETVLKPDSGVGEDNLPDVLINQLKLSVGATLLLPTANVGSPVDVNVAGLGMAGIQHSSLESAVVESFDTDNIAVVWKRFSFAQDSNVPRLDGTALSAEEHFPAVLAGYLDGLSVVRNSALPALLERYADMPVRWIGRATMVYARFVDASTHPRYLGEQAEADRLFRLVGLPPGLASRPHADFILDEECASMGTGNVPYFHTRAGSTELATVRGGRPDFHARSPVDMARLGLRLNGARSDAFHHYLLEECFNELPLRDGRWRARQSVFAGALADARPGAWWRGITSTLAALAVPFSGPQGPSIGWAGGVNVEGSAGTLSPGMCVSFHDVGGIVHLLRNAAGRDGTLEPLYEAALRGLDALTGRYSEILQIHPGSVFSGSGSTLLLRPDTITDEWWARFQESIDTRLAAGDLAGDLASGPAGTLMLLLDHLESGAAADGLIPRVERLRDLTLAAMDDPRARPWYDLAHGDVGLWWAASRIGRVLDEPRLVAAAADWFAGRYDGDPHPASAGWCNGHAGLLVVATEIMASANRLDWLADGRLAAMVRAATDLRGADTVDLSFCHGASGVTQSVLAAAHLLGDDALLAVARAYQERVIAAARERGYHTGAPGRTSVLGYQIGWAGVADTDLLLRSTTQTGAPALTIPAALVGSGRRVGRDG